jgi:hypothetical protein
MGTNPPYLTSQPALKKLLTKIRDASTPEKFTIKHLNEKFDMKGGSAAALIPFLKRIGFIASDGTPTEMYREFRNPSLAGQVAFKAMKHAYSSIYEINESAHKKTDAELKGIVAQVTGLDHDNPVIAYVVATFKTLKELATFDNASEAALVKPIEADTSQQFAASPERPREQMLNQVGLNIGYNINLNLPATSDIAVFDAIFKSLKEHLLRDSN